MVDLAVYLTPPLTGVRGEMWVMLLVGGEEYWYYLLDVPPSVNGVIGPFGYTDPYTVNIHLIRFPEQTVDGVTYGETQTGGFMTTQDWTFDVALTPVAEPEPEAKLNLLPLLVVGGVAFILMKKK